MYHSISETYKTSVLFGEKLYWNVYMNFFNQIHEHVDVMMHGPIYSKMGTDLYRQFHDRFWMPLNQKLKK